MPSSPTNSPRDLSRQQARESRQSATSTADCRDSYQVARHDRVIDAQLSNNFRHDLPDQPGVIALVGVGGAVEAFRFIRPFHLSEVSDA